MTACNTSTKRMPRDRDMNLRSPEGKVARCRYRCRCECGQRKGRVDGRNITVRHANPNGLHTTTAQQEKQATATTSADVGKCLFSTVKWIRMNVCGRQWRWHRRTCAPAGQMYRVRRLGGWHTYTGEAGVRDLISATRSERAQANEREDEDAMMCSP